MLSTEHQENISLLRVIRWDTHHRDEVNGPDIYVAHVIKDSLGKPCWHCLH